MPFEPAFFVLGTIVSRPAPDRCVADAGHKSTTKDHGLPARGTASSRRHRDLAQRRARDDRDSAGRRGSGSAIASGCVPSHTDPTVNLHDVLYAVDGDRVVDVWPVVARGYAAPWAGRQVGR